MPGLVPGIHVFAAGFTDVDGRDKPWSSPAKTKYQTVFSGMVRLTGPAIFRCKVRKTISRFPEAQSRI